MRLELILTTTLVMCSLLWAGCSSRSEGVDTGPASETPTAGPAGRTVLPTRNAAATLPALPGDVAFDAAAAMEHTRVLSVDIGARVSGTPGEQAAAEYIREQFAAAGYVSTIEPFSFEGSRFGAAEVTVDGNAIDARPIGGSEGGEARGRLVFVGLAMEADTEGKALDGAVAIADRGEILFRVKLENVLRAGAVGLIVVNDDDELIVGATLDGAAKIPVVSVSSAARNGLLAAAASGLTAVVTSSDSETLSMNVVARAPGTERCIVLVGAHHDTVPGAPGGNDNGSGVGHVLELARAFAADGLDAGLCFATFGGEESGLFGSQFLAAGLARAGDLPDVMVNFDVTGLGLPVEAIGERKLVDDAVEVAREAGVEVVASALPPNSSSDHASFDEAGVPVLFFTSGEFAGIHSPRDTYSALSLESFEAVGVIGYASIKDLYEELAVP